MKSDIEYIRHIKDEITFIESVSIGQTFENFDSNLMFKKSIERGATIYIESGWRKKGESKSLKTKYNIKANEILRELIIYSHKAHIRDPKTNMGRIFVGDVPTHIKEIA